MTENKLENQLLAQALYQIRILLSGYLGRQTEGPLEVRIAAHLAYALHNEALAITEGNGFDVQAALAKITAIDKILDIASDAGFSNFVSPIGPMNPFAIAWLQASKDLGIRVIHPYSFKAANEETFTSVGVYLPDFGSINGTLLVSRFDSPTIHEAADKTIFYRSNLYPDSYEPYTRELYIETLNDWGWFSAEKPPIWYSGAPWTQES